MDFADLRPGGVKALVDSGIETVPEGFAVPQHQRPNASTVASVPHGVPVIDMAELGGDRRIQTVDQIVEASREWGFFQVVNHGVDPAVLENMMKSARDFHELPVEEKMKYVKEDTQKSRYRPGISDNIIGNATVGWMDQFYMYLESSDDWPPVCREAALEYWSCVRRMAERLLGALSEGLGTAADFLQKSMLMDRPLLALKYYPRCPDPSLALGLRAHSDPTTITILLQDHVGGLQIFKEGRWVAVDPLRNAFVVNIGDLVEVIRLGIRDACNLVRRGIVVIIGLMAANSMTEKQIVSNGRFKSVEHRVIANAREGRLSIATFFGPRFDAKITPILCPSNGEETQHSRFKECVYGDYIRHFYGRKLDGKSSLDFARAA